MTHSGLPSSLVSRASEEDLPDILMLCTGVSLPASGGKDGFLVSGFPESVYRHALLHIAESTTEGRAIILVAKEPQSGLLGFLFGYDAAYGRAFMGGATESQIDARIGDHLGDYCILKQIAVARAARQRHVGQALAAAFLEHVPPNADVFLTIVRDPPNPASERFHEKLGFRPVLDSVSRGVDGHEYPSRIWRRFVA